MWFCEGFNGRGAPIPEWDGEHLYVVNGKPGDVYCVKPGGSGTVTKTHRVWHAPRKGGRDLPSPALVDDFLLVSSMSGILTCYDKKTGKIHFTERLQADGGRPLEIAAAPLVANGLVYFQSVLGGEVIVVKPAETLEIVARNQLDEAAADGIFRATLAPHRGRVLIREAGTLYCIGG
ncbi:MAG: PQQ-binding-like beta-propeller repeat protein [Verrucomicrobiota bacterium]